MPQKPFSFKWDMKRYDQESPDMTLVQGDSLGNVFNINLRLDGKPLDLTAATLVTLTFDKGDNTHVVGHADVVDAINGKISYVVGTQEISYPGEVVATIEVYEGEERITSQPFSFEVVSELDDGSAIASTTEYSVLANLVAAENSRATAENSRVTAEDGRVTAENDRSYQESVRQDIENERVEYENARQDNELKRAQAEATRVLAEEQRESNNADWATEEGNRVTRENARVTAESSRSAAEGVRANNEQNRQQAELNRNMSEQTRTAHETARVQNEYTRQINEDNRIVAEDTRESNEGNRAYAENQRVSSENARQTGYNVMISESFIIPKSPVDTYNSIATTYAAPQNGWTVRCTDNGKVWRYSDTRKSWEWIDTITAASYDALLNQVTNVQMSTPTDYTQFVVSIPGSAMKGELKCTIKGKTSSQVMFTVDFINKTAGSTTVNPNISRNNNNWSSSNLTLGNPVTNQQNYFSEGTQGYYDAIKVQDGNKYNVTVSNSGGIPQAPFSFDAIRNYEDRLGKIPGTTTAEKVAWLRTYTPSFTFSPILYGLANGINKAYVTASFRGNLPWDDPGVTSASSPALKQITVSGSYVDDNGFINFMLYSDPVATNDKAILLTGHGLQNNDMIENTTRNTYGGVSAVNSNLLSMSGITGQKDGDTIKKYRYNNVKTTETGTTDTILKITNHGIAIGDYCLIKNGSRSYSSAKATATDANTLTLDRAISGQTVGDSIYVYTYLGTQTAELGSATVYVDYVSLTATVNQAQSVNPVKVRSTGKNLFNFMANPSLYVNYATETKLSNGIKVKESSVITWGCVQYSLQLKPNTTYYLQRNYNIISGTSGGIVSVRNATNILSILGDISTSVANGQGTSFTTPSDGKIIIRFYASGATSETGEVDFTNIMLSEGNTALPYESYAEYGNMYTNVPLRSVGSIYDEITNDGKYIKRIADPKILQAIDVTYYGAMTNIARVVINKPTDSKMYNSTAYTGVATLEGYSEFSGPIDDIANVGKFRISGSANEIEVVFDKTVVTSLAQAQALLVGKKLTYVLATPTVSQIDAQSLMVAPNGNVVIEPIVLDNTRYTATGIAIKDTTLPIQQLVSVTKLVPQQNETILEVPIDLTTCTVSSDKLSFTSTALANGDTVTYEYSYAGTLTQTPTINISYPANVQAQISAMGDALTGMENRLDNMNAMMAMFKANSGTFTVRGTSQDFTDTFCTAGSLVMIAVKGVAQGTWTATSGDGKFTITSSKAEIADVAFDYYILRGAS